MKKLFSTLLILALVLVPTSLAWAAPASENLDVQALHAALTEAMTNFDSYSASADMVIEVMGTSQHMRLKNIIWHADPFKMKMILSETCLA